tara:strand:- start:376 stop:516 length:141 start_codon:yes stop_codon:yes gene_type:complete
MIIDSTFKEELDQYELPYKEALCGLGLVVSPETLDELKRIICGDKS